MNEARAVTVRFSLLGLTGTEGSGQ
jgi:hypothetical protein